MTIGKLLIVALMTSVHIIPLSQSTFVENSLNAVIPSIHRPNAPSIDKTRVIKVITDYLEQAPTSEAILGYPNIERSTTPLSLRHVVAWQYGTNTPPVVLFDVGLGRGPFNETHLIFWRRFGRWHHQEIPRFPNDGGHPEMFEAMQARVVSFTGGPTEVGAFYTSSQGSGAPVPEFVLLRLEGENWRILWGTPRVGNIGFDHGVVWFIGNGIDRFSTEYDISTSNDERTNIFSECHPCLHRKYMFTWMRSGNGYRCIESGLPPTPYNTLTEFIYRVSHNDTQRARELVVDEQLIARAREIGLKRGPNSKRWFLDSQDRERGPFKITSGPAIGVEITFVTVNGKVLISNLQRPRHRM